MNVATLSPREVATILAAIRYYQRDVEAEGEAFLFRDIATNCGAHPPMNAAEIDALAEEIKGEGERA